jgi:hypothetical protein
MKAGNLQQDANEHQADLGILNKSVFQQGYL